MSHKQDVATRVEYEFVINEMEGEDIIENYPHDTLAELLDHLPNHDGENIEIEVKRMVGSNASGIEDVSYLQIGIGELPGEFDCGANVPKFIAKQFTEKAREIISIRLERQVLNETS